MGSSQTRVWVRLRIRIVFVCGGVDKKASRSNIQRGGGVIRRLTGAVEIVEIVGRVWSGLVGLVWSGLFLSCL